MTTIPLITTIPSDPPSTADPTDFDVRADAFLGDFPDFATELNATATGMNTVAGEITADAAATAADRAAAEAAASAAVTSSGYFAESSTSLSLGTGSKAWTIGTGKSFSAGLVYAQRVSDPSVWMRGTITSYTGGVLTLNVTSYSPTTGGGPYTDWILMLDAVRPDPAVGRHMIPVPASAMTPRPTNGPSYGIGETSTNKVVRRTLDFDANTIEYAQFIIPMPKSWDEGQATFVPIWSHASTSTNFKVSWGLRALGLTDDEAMDSAFGTGQFSNDTGGTTDDLYRGPESAGITVASVAERDCVIFELYRKADDATNDTLAIDARLHGIELYINTNAGTDA